MPRAAKSGCIQEGKFRIASRAGPVTGIFHFTKKGPRFRCTYAVKAAEDLAGKLATWGDKPAAVEPAPMAERKLFA